MLKNRVFLFAMSFLCVLTKNALAGPFTCDSTLYSVRAGQLEAYNQTTNTYTAIGSPAASAYNAVGFNVLDNYAYGIVGKDVIRIHSNGTTETLFAINTLGVTATIIGGDMDTKGNLWIHLPNTRALRVHNITTRAVTTVTIDRNFNIGDFAVHPTLNMGLAFFNNGDLAKIDLTTGIITVVPGILPSFTTRYNSVWLDSSQRLFAMNAANSNLYEIQNYLTTPTAVLVSTRDPLLSAHDGFSCPYANFPNAAPIAKNDNFTTAYVTALSRNVLSNNGNGVDSDPEGTALTVTTTPVQAPQNGSLVLNANGTFTYTPFANFAGTDTFQYRLSDTIGNSAVGTVTINVTAPNADLVTVKTLQSATINPVVGGTVEFKIAVENKGPATAPNPTLTDIMPAGLTFASAQASQGTYDQTSGVWTINALANGARAELVISATVDSGTAGQTIANTATAPTGVHNDPITVGDDLSETIVVSNPSLLFDKNARLILDQNNDGKVNVGDQVEYSFIIKNTGNVALSNVKYDETAFNGHNGAVVLTGESLTDDVAPTGDSSDTAAAGIWETLGAGDSVTFTATYTANQDDIDLLQ